MTRRFLNTKLVLVAVVVACGLLPGVVLSQELSCHMQRDASDVSAKPGHWVVRASFNFQVFPSMLAQSIRVTRGGQDIKFELRSPISGESAIHPSKQFFIVPVQEDYRPANVRVTVSQGLSDTTGRVIQSRDISYEFLSVERLKVSGFSTFYDSKRAKGFRLSFPGNIPDRELAAAIEVTPAVPNLRVSSPHGWECRVTGDFEYDKDYVLKIKAVPVRSGSAVLEAEEIPFKGPGLKSEVTAKTSHSVVELIGRQLFPVTLSNVSKVQCRLVKVPPYLIPEVGIALASGADAKRPDPDNKAGMLKQLAASGKVPPVFFTEVVEDSDVFFAPEAKDHVLGYSLPLKFRSQPERGGGWVVTLSDPDSGSSNTVSRIVQVTDLAVSFKVSAKSLLVWVTSIHSGEPVEGAEILLFHSDGTRHLVGKTNKEGLLVVADGKEYPAIKTSQKGPEAGRSNIALGSVAWIVAATKSDACGVAVESVRLKPAAIRQARHGRDEPDTHKGTVFTERGVYRPGETVHFKCVTRAFKDKGITAVEGEKVWVEIIGPRQDVHYQEELTVGEFGSCHDSMPTKPFFPVGTYTVQVTAEAKDSSEDRFSTTFMLQDFKPPRHFARLSVKEGKRTSTEFVGIKREENYLEVDVSGEYYTGGPVRNGRVRWNATLVPAVNKVQDLSGYFFGNEDDRTTFLEAGESTLDGQGKLRIYLPVDRKILTGIYGLNVSATVLDIDGEPATEVQNYSPKPKYLVGIANHPKRVQQGYESPLKLIVVDDQGKKVSSGTVEAAVMGRESFHVQKRDESGNMNYLWEEGWVKTVGSTLNLVNGEATFQTSLHEAGTYLISFTFQRDGERYSSQTIFNVGWRTRDEWMERVRERDTMASNEILLSMTKQEYSVGESVEVQFHFPRPVKKCLVTLERGEILEHKVMDVPAKGPDYRFTVQPKHVPNVYVSVLAAAGREGFPTYTTQADTDMPMVYFGYADVLVSSKSQKLNLELAPGKAELKARPAEKTSISIKVTDEKGKGVRAEAAIAVVDEAVLALTRFQTPSLASLTRFDLPLSVFSGDLRLDLVTQDLFRILSTKPLTGGDGGGDGVGMRATLRKDFRPVAYYNPAVVTDDKGEARVEFKLPDTTTAYRVYAVVCDKGSGFVSGQRNMVVTKEFFVEPSVPRFLIPGDRVRFPVVLNNKTKEKGTYNLGVQAPPALAVSLDLISGSIEPFSTAVVKASAEVKNGTEDGKLKFTGSFKAGAERYEDAIARTFPILPVYLPVNKSTIGDFSENTTVEAQLPDGLQSVDRKSLNPGDFKAQLSLSTTDWARIVPGLKYMLHYPYGCVEQTSSGVIPLAGIRSLVQAGVIPGIPAQQVDEFLKGGVDRLLSMQVSTGGFGYWPGDKQASWWGTMYATFALTMAKEAGFEVPEERMESALAYLRRDLFQKGEDSLHGRQWTRELALFNLAMAGQLSPSELEQFFSQYAEMSFQSKALLILAARRIGYLSEEELAQMVEKLNPTVDVKRKTYYDSSYREIAACLMAALDLRTDLKKAGQWAGFLQRGINPEGRWFSTADSGWCLLALGKYYQTRESKAKKNIKVTVDYRGSDPVELTMTGTTAYVELDPFKLLQKGGIDIKSDAKDLISYTLDLIYPDVATDPARLNRGFSLSKRIENLNGKDEIRVGDIVRVTLEIDLRDTEKKPVRYYDNYFEYLALVDPVPAGLVPINSELKTEGFDERRTRDRDSGAGWPSDFIPSYQEFRDDAVRVFKNRAWGSVYKYTYLARAVAEGDFWLRGSRISLMYDPDTFGRTEGKRVTILPMK